MAYALVQAQYSGLLSATPAAFASSNTGGNTLVICANWSSSDSIPTVSDSKGNSYSVAKSQIQGGGGMGSAVWVAFNCAAGANSVTVTLPGQVFDAVFVEYSGLSSLDQVAAQYIGAGTNPTSGNTPSTTSANEAVIGFVANSLGNPTAGSGFTSRANGVFNHYVNVEDKRVTVTGAQAADFTLASSTYICICVTLAEPGGAPASPVVGGSLSLLGVG